MENKLERRWTQENTQYISQTKITEMYFLADLENEGLLWKVSDVLSKVLKRLGVAPKLATPYHPQTNG